MARTCTMALSICCADLINAIRDPEAVARHLLSRGVLTEQTVSAVRLVPGAGTLLNSTKLMMLVRTAIQTDRSKFPLLVAALKELPELASLGGKLEGACEVSGEPLQQHGYTGPSSPRLSQSYFQPSRLDQSGKIRPFGQPPSSGDIISFKWINKGEEKTFKVRETFAGKWRDLGKKFGFSEGKLNTFATNNRDDPEKCFDDVISLWKSDGSVPPAAYLVTWRGLITALKEVGGVYRKVETLITALERKMENTVLRPPHQSPAESGEQPPPSKRAKVDPLSEDMQTYASYLKEVYTKPSTISYDKWPHVTSRKFINLLLIGKECSDKQEAERLKKATIHGNIDDIIKSKAPLTMDEVACNLADDSLPKCILVEGAPGVGKSTFAWELCGKWGRGEMLQQYKLVVLLRLREKKVRNAKTVEDLFRYHNKRVRQAVVEEIEQTGGKGVLLLLEGYDELPVKERSEDSFFMSVIKGDELPEATVLVTSRHSASDSLYTSHQCKRKISQHVEIIGFTKDNINACLEASSNRDSEFLTGIHKYLECYPHIHSMMYIPLNCAIVVEVYRNCKKDGTLVPKTMTELYFSLIRSLLLRYLNEHPEYSKQKWNIQSFSDLPQKVFDQFCEVARIAYDGFVNGQQVIFSDLPDDFESLSLMQCVPELYVDQGAVLSYNFLHLTVQEFMTAFHMSRLPVAEQVKAFTELVESETHNVVLRFLAGLTKFADVSSENLQSIFSTQRGRVSLEALHWIFETQDDISRLLDIFAHDDSLTISFGDLGPFDAYVLGYCTSHSNCVWEYDYIQFSDQDPVDMLAHGAGQQGPGCSGRVSTLDLVCDGECLLPQFPCCITEHLELVSLTHFPIDDGFTALSNSTSLTKVTLDHCDVSVAAWKAVFQHPTLEELLINSNLCTLEAQHMQGNSSLKTLNLKDSLLSAAEWHGLGIALQDNATLERLFIWNEQDFLEDCDIEEYTIGDDVASDFFEMLSQNTTIKELQLSGYCIGPAVVSSLAAALCHNHTLERLDLSRNTIHFDEPLFYPSSSTESHDGSGDSPAAPQEQGHCISEGVTSLNKILSQNTSLKHLDLSGCCINPHEAQHLASGMDQNQTMEYLDLSHNAIGDEGATALASMLEHNKTLKTLKLRSTSIGVSGALKLIDSLTHNTTLEELSFNDNTVTDEGATALASLLKDNKTLKALKLSDTSIDIRGVVILANALTDTTALEKLDLDYNAVGDEGATALASILKDNKTLKTLKLHSTSIGVSGVLNLIDSLTHNTTLEKLSLINNAVGDEGATALASLLKNNKTLKTLKLGSNSIDMSGILKLIDSLTHNTTLKRLVLDEKDVSEAQRLSSNWKETYQRVKHRISLIRYQYV